MAFFDLFSKTADQYASSRPGYPDSLFRFIASCCASTDRVWDCGCGNGQAAIGLAGVFRQVEATDASEAQISKAYQRPNIRYSVQRVEFTDFDPASFDAVCVAQALHWFEFQGFFAEVLRVLKPGGVFAAWGYNWFQINETIDREFEECILKVIAPYWAPQNALIWNGYKDVPFPFAAIDAPEFRMERSWNMMELLAFVHTWSGVQKCISETGSAFYERAAEKLAVVWGDPEMRRLVVMPLVLIAGRKEDSGGKE